MTLLFLDVWSRLFFRSNPWRYKFNAVVAMHECDGVGFEEMRARPNSAVRTWAVFAASGLAFVGAAVAGAVWIMLQGLKFLVVGLERQRAQTSFKDRTALVTGAGRGIGLELTSRLIGSGATVIALGSRQHVLDELLIEASETGSGSRLITVTADVAAQGAVAAALRIAKLDADNIDLVFVNAGVKERQLGALDGNAIRRTFAVNLFGAVETVLPLLDAWIRRGTGQIVFISSLGKWHGMVSSGGYNSSKAAVSILADSLTLDLTRMGAPGIRVTTAEPGLVSTQLVGGGMLQRLLSITPNRAAREILDGVACRRRRHRFPCLFVLLTAGIVLAPAWLRIRVLSRVKDSAA